MKKILLTLLLVLTCVLGAKAQFEEGTKYFSAQLSNLNMSFSEKYRFRLSMNLNTGVFLTDGWMLHGTIGYQHLANEADQFNIGAGLRYHFYQNGVTLGTGVEYVHASSSINDLRLPIELGYVFYLNQYLAIEPALYYKLSINDVSKGSEVGFRIGLGYYF